MKPSYDLRPGGVGGRRRGTVRRIRSEWWYRGVLFVVRATRESARARPAGHRSGVSQPKQAVSPPAVVGERTDALDCLELLAALGSEVGRAGRDVWPWRGPLTVRGASDAPCDGGTSKCEGCDRGRGEIAWSDGGGLGCRRPPARSSSMLVIPAERDDPRRRWRTASVADRSSSGFSCAPPQARVESPSKHIHAKMASS